MRLVEGFLDGDGFVDPVDGGIDVFQPGESQDNILVSQVHDVEGGLASYSSNIEEQGGGKPDYSFRVNGVVRVSGLNGFLEALGGDSLFSNEPPVDAGDTRSTIDQGSGFNGFHRVRGDNKLDWDLHSR